MPDHSSIYAQQAQTYHEMIAKQPSLQPFIEEIRRCEGRDVVEIGAGSGRITVELAQAARSVVATDASAAMLKIAADRLTAAGLTNWETCMADMRRLPLPNDSADLVVAGWSVGYVADPSAPQWEEQLELVIREMQRVLRPGGTILIIETMGTGCELPDPPAFLKPYYNRLEAHYGFQRDWFRLDYTFDSLEQAERLARFFFGDELGERVRQEQLLRLPECAGIWRLSPG